MSTHEITFEQLQRNATKKILSPWAIFEDEFESLHYFEDLKNLPHLKLKRLFGGLAFYQNQTLLLVLMEDSHLSSYKDKIFDFPLWYGALIATEFKNHQKLLEQCPCLENHPVLKKWLYLRRQDFDWIPTSQKIISLILKRSDLIGVNTQKNRSPKDSSTRLPNLGPKSKRDLNAIGIKTFGDLKKKGWKNTWKLLVKEFPERVNLNMGRALYACLAKKPWRDLSESEMNKIRRIQIKLKKKMKILSKDKA